MNVDLSNSLEYLDIHDAIHRQHEPDGLKGSVGYVQTMDATAGTITVSFWWEDEKKTPMSGKTMFDVNTTKPHWRLYTIKWPDDGE